MKGRSECDFCHHPLSVWDLVPVVSFFLLKGKCRYCWKRLSWQYPVVELSIGVLLVALFLLQKPFLEIRSLMQFIVVCLLFLDLLVLAITDIKYGVLPNRYIVLGIVIQGLLLVVFHQHPFITALSAALGSALFLGIIVLATKGKGMGMGDVKYAFLMGLMVGFPVIIPSFYLAFLTGAGVAIILIVLGKKKFHGGSIPFGPFLIIATFGGYFWGAQLWSFLLHLVGL